MGSNSVAVRILNSERKTGMDWTFIEIHDHASLSYEQLISKILSWEFSDCKLKETVFPCQNIRILYGLLSTNHKDIKQIRGGPKTDIIEKERKFSMLYFSLFCEHNKECVICLPKETVAVRSKNVFEVMMQSARDNANSELPTLKKMPQTRKTFFGTMF